MWGLEGQRNVTVGRLMNGIGQGVGHPRRFEFMRKDVNLGSQDDVY